MNKIPKGSANSKSKHPRRTTTNKSKAEPKKSNPKENKGQPSINNFVNTKPRHNESKSTNLTKTESVKQSKLMFQTPENPQKEAKQRTPPSLEREPESKKQLLDNSTELTEPKEMAGKGETTLPENKIPSPKPQTTIKLTESEQRIVQALGEQLKPLKRSIDNVIDKLELHSTEMKSLRSENNILKAKIGVCDRINKGLHERLKRVETRMLEKNIIIKGIRETPFEPQDTTWDKVVVELTEMMGGDRYEVRRRNAEDLSINNVQRVGRYKQMENRPVLVTFGLNSDVIYVLKNKKHLKPGIYLDREYTPEVDKDRRLLRPILRDAQKHSEFKGKSKLDGGDLVILGRRYNTTNLHALPAPLSGFNATSNSNDDIIGFFGELNPLSNFHHAPFTCNGSLYHCSEQYIQHTKAKYFEDEGTASSIMAATTAAECKQISKDIRGYDRDSWLGNAKILCTPGILAKFEQNPLLSTTLLQTGDKTIIESSRDREWGTGIPLNDDRCLEREKWGSQGILGEILEEIRSTIKNNRGSQSGVTNPTNTAETEMEIQQNSSIKV